MSGTASRYIGGVPYGPAMGVGRYNPRAVSPGAPLPVDTGAGRLTIPRGAPAATDGMGIAVNPATGMITPVGSSGGGSGGMTNLLLAAALGVLPYVPDAVQWIGNQLGGEAQAATPSVVEEPLPPADQPAAPGAPDGFSGNFTGMPTVPFGGGQFGWVPAGSSPWVPAGSEGVIWDPTGAASNLGQGGNGWVYPGDLGVVGEGGTPIGGDGFAQMGVTPGEFTSVSAPVDATGAVIPPSSNTYLGGALDLGAGYDFGLTGSMGSLPMLGDVATGLVNLGAGYLGNLASAGTVNPRSENSAYGQQIGSTLGGIIGSFIPVPGLGTFVGATLGGVAGASIGDQVGAPPTIGRNFGATGTFNPDGTLAFGGFGGDNGGTAADAQGFTDWFGRNLLQQAGARGLQFNPNMAGVQFSLGGFDNFSRSGVTPGGFFFDPMRGGSPENYALRPGGGDAFSPTQAQWFTDAVLADLAARDVFTPTGQGRGRDFYDSTLGAPLGSYGGYSFADMFGQRQGAIAGWIDQQQRDAAAFASAVHNAEQGRDATLASIIGMPGVQATDSGFIYAGDFAGENLTGTNYDPLAATGGG